MESKENPLQRLRALIGEIKGVDPLPIRHSLHNYGWEGLRDDGRAGLNVALMAFPQCMAYALIAGVPIHYGLLCYIAASLLGPLFGSSKLNSYGPSNATSVLLLSIFLTMQVSDEQKLQLVPVVVLLAGLLLVCGAFLRVATLIQYVSRTVITGYITAAALLIIANQIKSALGFSIPKTSSFIGVLIESVKALPQLHWPSLVLVLITAGVLLLLRRYPALPNVALTLIVASVTAFGMQRAGLGVATLNSLHLSDISFRLIALDFDSIGMMAGAALTLAFLITLEAGSIGKSLAARAGDRLDANQEMFGLGIANVASAMVGGMAASASLTRSSLNGQSGSKSGLCNVYAAIMVVVLLITLTPLIGYIPRPALAVIVISIGISLISSRNIRIVANATRSDRTVFIVTLTAGLLLALDVAIYLGTALSILLFLNKVARPEMVEYAFNEEGHLAALQAKQQRAVKEVSIVHVEGELFFGASELFRDQIRRVCEDPNLKVVVLKMRNAHHVDATSVMALEELIRYMRERDSNLLMSEVREDLMRVFRNSGIIELIGEENLFTDHAENPTLSTAQALKRAREFLGGEDANVSIYFDAERDRIKKAQRGDPG